MKKILILGATSGIAQAIAHHFAKEKTNLILAGRDVSELEAMAQDLQIRHQVEVTPAYFDALDYESHADFIAACTKNVTLDGVVLAYGYMTSQEEAQENFAEARKMMEINYVSTVSLLERVADYMEQQKKGFICVISSVAGDRGRQSNYIYGSTKGALTVYLQGLRNRLFPSGVQVLTVKPGFVDTKMTFGQQGMFLVAQPQAIARAISKSLAKGKHSLYAPSFWALIMLIIKMIPESIFKRLKL
ncbi:SDR family oxidoreductase [Ammoniphilus sp. CFH 90114]|uniref:SDR family oxidoreductase n=1 Tax=Ammoniphilus sp. CFH 90114 TaxID=2493665 RepID=UPI00100F3444|nr:SDR family oxidoreductase [Ammoniphilus sp. CFH 90114]RXT04519.1 SDR family oxidoreductase [Ammoniphilus sp. CFH 90114]